jgi:hypothetical protein
MARAAAADLRQPFARDMRVGLQVWVARRATRAPPAGSADPCRCWSKRDQQTQTVTNQCLSSHKATRCITSEQTTTSFPIQFCKRRKTAKGSLAEVPRVRLPLWLKTLHGACSISAGASATVAHVDAAGTSTDKSSQSATSPDVLRRQHTGRYW